MSSSRRNHVIAPNDDEIVHNLLTAIHASNHPQNYKNRARQMLREILRDRDRSATIVISSNSNNNVNNHETLVRNLINLTADSNHGNEARRTLQTILFPSPPSNRPIDGPSRRTTNHAAANRAGPSGVSSKTKPKKTAPKRADCPICLETTLTARSPKCKKCKQSVCKTCKGRLRTCPFCRAPY